MNEKIVEWVSFYQLHLNDLFHKFMDQFKKADSNSFPPKYRVYQGLSRAVDYLEGMDDTIRKASILDSYDRSLFWTVAYQKYEDLCNDVWNGYNLKKIQLRG